MAEKFVPFQVANIRFFFRWSIEICDNDILYSWMSLMIETIICQRFLHLQSCITIGWNPFWLSSIITFILLLYRGAFTYDIRCFLGIFDLPTYPNQILYYISIFSKIRWCLNYLPTSKSDVICECSLIWIRVRGHPKTISSQNQNFKRIFSLVNTWDLCR